MMKTNDGLHYAYNARAIADDESSTVDKESRHMHKSRSSYRDGYRAHIAAEPTTGLIAARKLAPANTGDGTVAADLLASVPTIASDPIDGIDLGVEVRFLVRPRISPEPPARCAGRADPIPAGWIAEFARARSAQHGQMERFRQPLFRAVVGLDEDGSGEFEDVGRREGCRGRLPGSPRISYG